MQAPRKLKNVKCLEDLDGLAKSYLPKAIWEFGSAGTEKNVSRDGNRRVFDEIWLQPRILKDVSNRSIERKLFGKNHSMPFGISPMGASAMFGFEADVNFARAAKVANIPYILSGSSLIPLERVADANSEVWFQAYVEADRDSIGATAERVREAGIRNLVITVDVPVGGNRRATFRRGFEYPMRPNFRIFLDGLTHPRWLTGNFLRTLMSTGMPHLENYGSGKRIPIISTKAKERSLVRDALNWEDIKWLREKWEGRLLLKGVLSPADARTAAASGIDGIIVSNHGGRMLDTAVPPLKVLPEIAAERGDMAILFDSGIRRGVDVVKALALGADFVFLGRPFLFAAALAEEAGIKHVIDLLAAEIDRTMAQIMNKELVQLRRDRVTFAMIVMIPLIQLVLFGYSINTKIRDIPVGVVDQSGSAVGRVLVSVVEATGVVKFTAFYTSVEEAEASVRNGSVRAVLVLPDDLTNRLVRSPSVNMGLPPSTQEETSRPVGQWIVDGTDTVISGAIQSLRNMPLTELFHDPPNRNTATFEVALFYNPEQRSAVNTVPGLVGIILTMTMILFTSAAIVREHERGNMEMLITTPVKSLELMIGKITPYIFIGLIQASIILALGYLLFDVHFWGNLLSLFFGTLLFIGACLSVGLVFSTLATTQLQAMQMMVFILIPSILLSGFMFPYEGMPVEAQYIAEGLPATHFMRIVRGVTLRDATLLEMPYDVLWLAGFFVVGLGIAALRFKKRLD